MPDEIVRVAEACGADRIGAADRMGRTAVTEPLFSLAGRKALVAGASRGIGEVIAVALARAGADVALTA